ncbi:hypothetical protein M0R89_20115 (plasmid) [Halorussus limi]|uniref:Putative peptidase inhibitor domain-containing protein n=1 Tax=Halorussus limi TaxID=2938695 RepID=A0A8U0I000_9EURY|nr:hypothetical protein [Halorussus limi]UPV76469.1 hypothetical protein M0R89_20115 [Halorussus limi]
MTYLSHTVRSLREDPIPGETVRLVLTLGDDADPSAIAESVESLGGEVVRDLEFDRLLVEVDQTDLDAVCSLDGVSSVETDAVLGPT